MGFLGGLSRLVQGKPVFEVPQDSPAQQAANDSQTETINAQQGPKILPTVLIERNHCHVNGSHMRVTAHIKNHSDQQIELDKIRLLGTSTELDTHLQPNESREFTIFQGNTFNNTSYNDAHIMYKDMSGDYFESYHTVQFQQEKDGSYSPQQFRFVGPVKDI